VVKHWNRLLRDVMESPFLALVKNKLVVNNMFLLIFFLTPPC